MFRRADAVGHALDRMHGSRTDDEIARERTHCHVDLVVPPRVVFEELPAAALPLPEIERQLGAHVGAIVLWRAEPAQAVERVERLGLPVVRPVRANVEQGGAVTRPIQWAVLVSPIEGDRLAGAEPIPCAVVPPGPVGVEGGRHRQRQQAHGYHGRGARGSLAQAHSREPQPRGQEQQQRQPAEQRLARIVLGHRRAVGEKQYHQSEAAQ